MVYLETLIAPLEADGLVLEKAGPLSGTRVNGLANDSRRVEPGALFVAVRGEQADGHRFIEQAVRAGAAAVIGEEERAWPHEEAAYVRVRDSRAALALAAARFYDDPTRVLRLVGVTGTNGKTTTTFLVHHLLGALGEKSGLIGTVEWRVGEETIPSTHTTPDALDLNRLFRRMADAGCTACVMEVSSHALDQQRVRGARFAAAVFTNLTHDHLDYHGSFEAYFQAKKRLFDGLPPTSTALYNADDPSGARMVAGTAARVRAYGQGADADVRLEIVDDRLDGLVLCLDGRERKFRLVGRFNAYNLAAAYGAGRALGFEADRVLDALQTAPPVPGRFEQMRFEGDVIAIVDYAHTPDALENVLRTIRETASGGRVWCVFGCGGDRDAGKRPVMAGVAEQYADRVIATSDNPRTEPPERILEDIRGGFARPEQVLFLPDRREAIRRAVREAAPGDVILVAGKGHESYQIVGTEKLHFDDREEVRAAFEMRSAEFGMRN